MRLTTILLIVLLVLVAAAKIFFVAQTTTITYDSFYGIRQVENIRATGTPLVVDDLSYQGRIGVTNMFFYYLLTIFSFVIPIFLLFKYGSIVLFILTLILVFRLARKLYVNRWIALLVTTFAGISTAVFTPHLSSMTSSSLFLLIYLGALYAFFSLKKLNNNYLFIVLIILGTFVSSMILVVLLGFVIYLLLLKLESLSTRAKELEALALAGLFAAWYHLIVYKKLFLQYGIETIWQTLPKDIFLSSYQQLSISLALSIIGIIPLIFGLYAIYYSLFRERRRRLLLLVALSVSFGALLWMGLLPFQEGLLYITITFILLSGYTMKKANNYLKKVVLPQVRIVFAVILLIIAILSFLPLISFQSNVIPQTPSQETTLFLSEIADLLPEDATILGSIEEGHMISLYTGRKNFYDTNYLFAPQVQQRYDDAKTMFLSHSKIRSLELLHYYDIDYIYISELTKSRYPSLIFSEDDCFELVAKLGNQELYEVKCEE